MADSVRKARQMAEVRQKGIFEVFPPPKADSKPIARPKGREDTIKRRRAIDDAVDAATGRLRKNQTTDDRN